MRRRLLGALATAALLPACGGRSDGDGTPREAVFTPDGLHGRTIRRLRSGHGALLAATDSGAWLRDADAWHPIGLTGETVLDIASPAPGHLLASLSSQRVVRTRDGGLSWHPIDTDFGGGMPETMHALLADAARGRLLATGHGVLAESHDDGVHWRVLAGEWQAFSGTKDALLVDPRGDVWWGGQDAIEGWALHRVRRAGGGMDSHPALLPSPSTAKGLLAPSGTPGRLIASGEGGIVHTLDDGASWHPLLQSAHARFYFGVVADPLRPRRLVTAGWDKNFDSPQRLVVEWSDDDGATWRSAEHPDPQLFGGVRSLSLRVERGRSVIHLGLYRGGAMKLELP